MIPTQKQSSLNRVASQKQFPMTCVLYGVLLCASDVAAEVFRADGIIMYRAYKQDGELAFSTKKAFTCWVDGRNWSIITTNLSPTGKRPAKLYYEIGYDGSNVFSLGATSSESLENYFKSVKTKRKPPEPFFIDGAMITSGPVPYFAVDGDIGPIWFAYCSSWYLDTRVGQPIKPIWAIPPRLSKSTKFYSQAEITRHPDSPRLPAYAAFFSDGTVYSAETDSFSPRTGPYNVGYTNGVFTATDFVKAGDGVLPKNFYFALFRPKPGGAENSQLVIAADWTGVAQNVGLDSARHISLPQIRTNTYVRDYRTTASITSGCIEYGITNGQWRNVGDPVFQKSESKALEYDQYFQKSSRNRPKSQQAKAFTRYAVYAFLLASTLVCGILMFTRWKNDL